MPTILIIEDNIQFADLVRQFLQRRGVEAEIATDGASGLRSFLERTYELLLVDMRLPLMNGDEVCKKIRESAKGRAVPIIMMSGYVKDLSQIDRLKKELGLIGFLTKPFPSDALSSLVASALQDGAASAPPAAEGSQRPPVREDLGRTPFALVLLYLLKNRGTGTLTVTRDAVKRVFFFLDGAPLELDQPSGSEDEDFGSYLRHKDCVNAHEFREYERRKKTGEDPRDIFIKMGCLTPQAFRDETGNFVADRLIDCFSWKNGTVLFEWKASFVKSLPAASAFLPAFFFRGFKTHLPPEKMAAFLEKRGELYADRTAAFYDIQNHLAPEIADAAVLDLIDGSRTCAEIVNAVESEDAPLVLYTLDYLRTLSYDTAPTQQQATPPYPVRERTLPAAAPKAEAFEDLGSELTELADEIGGLGDLAKSGGAPQERGELAALEDELRKQWDEIKDKNYYEIFGMTRQSFSFDKIKQAYFRFTRTFGPEKFFASSSEIMGLAEELLSKVSNAYNTLSNVVSKENYDELLSSQVPTGAEERQFFEKVQYQSGKVLLEQGQFESAEKAFQTCLTITPDKPEYLAHLAVAVYHNPANRGNSSAVKRAKDLVNKSLQGEKLAIAYSLKGTILLDEGLLNLAEAEFNKALKIAPGNKTALKKLEFIKQRREEENKGFFQKMFK